MKSLTLFFAVVALSFSGTANAQQFGYDAGCGGCGTAPANNCGRIISTNQAANLWAGYCHEDCTIDQGAGCGSGCGLFSRLKGRGGGFGGGCNSGCGGGIAGGGCGAGTCFGYPSNCGCNAGCGGGGFGGGFANAGFANAGCGGGCGGGGGLFAKLKAKMQGLGCRANSCGGDSCGTSSCGGRSGCGLFSKLCGRKNRGGGNYTVTTAAVDHCGCGNNGQYFDYAVGADYGNAGMQSSVAGSLTGACCGGSTGFAQPMMQGAGAPIQSNQFQAAPVQMQQQVGQQAAGAISEAIQN